MRAADGSSTAAPRAAPESRRVVVAHNFATGSENRIHADDVARRYGYAGGLVPGVATYAYLVGRALEMLGTHWLEDGEIAVQLVHPVYDGDRVVAAARRDEERPDAVSLELHDSAGRLCARGSAGPVSVEADLEDPLPAATPPRLEERPPVSLAELYPGRVLATLDWTDALPGWNGDESSTASFRAFLADRYRDPDPRFLASGAPLHPALAPELANQVLARTVRLGPWIHARSTTRHYAPLLPDGLQARGKVTASYTRNGHEMVELDVRLYGAVRPGPGAAHPQLLARVEHRAIVRPRAGAS